MTNQKVKRVEKVEKVEKGYACDTRIIASDHKVSPCYGPTSIKNIYGDTEEIADGEVAFILLEYNVIPLWIVGKLLNVAQFLENGYEFATEFRRRSMTKENIQ